MSDKDVSFELAYEFVGSAGKAKVVARFSDGTSFSDKIDVTSFQARRAYLDNLCDGRNGIDREQVRLQLEKIADESVALGEASGEPADGADGVDDGSTATLLVRMALKGYRLGRTLKNDVFAVPLSGSRVIRSLHDSGGGSLRAATGSWSRRFRWIGSSAPFGGRRSPAPPRIMRGPTSATMSSIR